MKNLNKNFPDQNLNWTEIQKDMKDKFGLEIYESWLKKISFEEKQRNYVLLSVSTRFIRDWIVSRYLDQILRIIKNQNKEISRIEFKIDNKDLLNKKKENDIGLEKKVSFLKDSFLQYNRIDKNKSLDNFIVGQSNTLALRRCVFPIPTPPYKYSGLY